MRLEEITATAHPEGNRIDLCWRHPDPGGFPGVRVVRREGTHPTSPDPDPSSPSEGRIVASTDPEPDQARVTVGAGGLWRAIDQGLAGETVYYYALFPFRGDPPEYDVDRRNRSAAMATGPYDMAGQMAELLPAIYHRYDGDGGPLRRFLELSGSQLDCVYSFARALLSVHDLDLVDGRLLPLLAEWIGWKTDYRLEIDAQRQEIRHAPALYQTIGGIPTVEATVRRLTGWGCRSKEFVHNVFLSNRPERLNLWARRLNAPGAGAEPGELLSLNFAYEGRPAVVRDGAGVLWLFYQTWKRERWELWYKTFSAAHGISPSRPVDDLGPSQQGRHPAAAIRGETLHVFWDRFDAAAREWRIGHLSHDLTGGPPPATSLPGDGPAERRSPAAIVEQGGPGLWLFWLERTGSRWQLRYNRHDGTAWELAPSAVFPVDGPEDPRVDDDVFVLFHPTDPSQRIWVFWTRQETVIYRVKQGLDAAASDWSPIRALPKADPGDHDREPAAAVDAAGNLEVFWSSNRGGGWSIRRRVLDAGTHAWGPAERLTDSPYSQRNPLPLAAGDGGLLIYRSNRSIAYGSEIHGATETIDGRYAGSTTVDAKNAAKIALRGDLGDFQTYTYDAGRGGERSPDDWYARDTLGLYLVPDTADVPTIENGRARLERVLGDFLPATARAVLIVQPETVP
ncbi:MAG: hypothetical protein GY856_06410 [bacterium]|nr:hypothetical protein [bacterium]